MFICCSVGVNCVFSGYDCSEVDYVIMFYKLIGCVIFFFSVVK